MLIFLGKLSTLMNMSETVVSGGRPEKARQHQRMSYYVDGHQLCRDTFKFMHAYVFYYLSLLMIITFNSLTS